MVVLRREPGLWFVPLAVGGSLLLDLHTVEHGPVLCVSRLLFGIPCAGCGLTRAFVALGHGDLDVAIAFNPLSPLLYLWMAGWWIAAVASLARGQSIATSPRWLGFTGLCGFAGLWAMRLFAFFAWSDWRAEMARDAVVARLWRAIVG